MKILVVFGSKSDENVSLPLVQSLSKDFEVEYEVISAHRDLEKLQQRISVWKGDAIVAGAGLAAALPGVVAAMTDLPVFGVPVPSQFGGIDSLCSIAQMPPGVPVMSCGPGRTEEIVRFFKAWEAAGKSQGLHIVVPANAQDTAADIEKAVTLGAEKGISVTWSAQKKDGAFNVYLVTAPEDVRSGEFCIHVPYFEKKDIGSAAKYLSVLDWTEKGGLWLGANNTRNAVQSLLRLKKGA